MDLAQQLDHYRSQFPGPHLELVLASMVAGNTLATLWEVPQPDAPPLLLLWDKGNNVFYLGGDCNGRSLLRSLADVVAHRVGPQALAERVPDFKTRPLTPSLEDSLPYIFPGIPLRASPTLFLVHDSGRHASVAQSALPDVAFIPITSAALAGDVFAYSDYVRAEIRSMWPSEDHFYEHGFGTLAVLHDEIICWCTAEYMSSVCCGIGIATVPKYQRLGVATETAAHFVREAQERGATPCWECACTNRGSVRVAEKAGFVRRSEETYWEGSFAH